jgi:hypothetical protein
MEKRGQISIFIIVGGIVLLLIILGVILISTQDGNRLGDGLRDAFSSAPEEVVPFTRYVDACVESLITRAVDSAGAQGGILYANELGLRSNYLNPTEADGVSPFKSGTFMIPYWSYIEGSNTCDSGCVSVFQPPPLRGDAPGTIQSQLESYVARNIDLCLENKYALGPISIAYDAQGSPEVEVIFAQSTVTAKVTYPFTLQQGGNTYTVSTFTGKTKVPFVSYYNDAVFLTAILNETRFFEKATMSMISVYAGMDPDKLPPLAGSDQEFISTLFWTTPQVKAKLGNVLLGTFPYFTATNSRNYAPVNEFYSTKYYSLKKNWYEDYELPLPLEFERYEVDFQFVNRTYLEINDGEQYIRPESASVDWFPWIGINRLRTQYHISYPVLVTLSDPADGFRFTFATEVNVRNNVPMQADYVPFDYSSFDDYIPKTTQFCDPGQRTSKNVSFRVTNGMNGSGEPDVALTFVCGQEACPIGRSDTDGRFNGALPICAGGQMQLLKKDFEKTFVRIDPSIKNTLAFGDVLFEPYRFINATAKHISITKNQVADIWYRRQGTQSLHDSEEVIVQLTRVSLGNKPGIITADFTTFTTITPDGPSELRLLPGYYEGTILGVVNEPLVFLPNERCVSYRELFSKKKKCYFVPNETISMDSFSAGGATFGPQTSYLYIPKDRLDSSSIIEFRELFIDIYGISEQDRIIEDLEQTSDLNSYAVQYKKDLQPVFR